MYLCYYVLAGSSRVSLPTPLLSYIGFILELGFRSSWVTGLGLFRLSRFFSFLSRVSRSWSSWYPGCVFIYFWEWIFYDYGSMYACVLYLDVCDYIFGADYGRPKGTKFNFTFLSRLWLQSGLGRGSVKGLGQSDGLSCTFH